MPLALRLAVRELRGGLTGLRLLAVCLFLGVAALAGVGSLSSAITAALGARGQEILGGDVEVRIAARAATAEQRAAIARFGVVSEGVRMRSMVGAAGSEMRVLGELKAVDRRYPLYGQVTLESGRPLQQALAGRSAVVGRALADQLGLVIGDRLELGHATLAVTGVLQDEPDRAGEGFALGPTVMVSMDSLAATRLVQPGSLLRYHYRIKMPSAADPAAVKPVLDRKFPDVGWQIRDRSNGAPGVRRFIERLGQFLTLVSLTALVVAGVGVGNGVTAYLEAKAGTIATLKSLGASSRLIVQSYCLQIGLVALAAVTAGAMLGAVVPWLVAQLAAGSLPVPPRPALYPAPLLVGCAYGLLIALVFALWPLARAGRLPAARLFRAGVESAQRPPWRTVAASLAAAAGIAALAILQAREKAFAAGFIAAALALLLGLMLLAALIRWLAVRAPRPQRALPRLALANLHRPGALTRQLVVALGLGLTLFATLAVIETNLAGQIRRSVPARAPTFFVLDLPKEEAGRFTRLVRVHAPGAALRLVPSLRGPVTALNGTPVSRLTAIPEGAWFLRGDRGLTYASEVPPGNRIVAGQWWPNDYSGPPLVSIDSEAARATGLKVGDKLSVSVLGVEVVATIASLRSVDWDSLGFNFVLVFSPNALEGAPHSFMATITVAPHEERGVYRTVTRAFPTASVIRVQDVITTAAALLDQLAAAVRAAASVTVAAGVAVLVGALAAGRRARIYDAVLLKVLGATRGQVLQVLLIEYGLLAAVVALLAFGLGTVAGWYAVVHVLELEWQPDWQQVVLTILVGALVTVGLGLAGSWGALSVRPNRALRRLS